MSISSCLSQFFILSPRGDSIIRKECRGDISKPTTDIFFRNVKFWNGEQRRDAPPIFHLDGITYLYLKNNGLYFVGTTKSNVSPSLMMELLLRLTKVFKDYCGILTEETIRRNFILLYELLDEVLDSGYAQGISTEILKSFVFNEPSSTLQSKSSKSLFRNKMSIIKPKNKTTKSSEAVNRPISYSNSRDPKKQEIFIDIVERISVTFNHNGHSLSSSIDGRIEMKSYLNGNPELKLALNEDLTVISDDCNFHQCVSLDNQQFQQSQVLTFIPPDGEFSLLNYRITNDNFIKPFRVSPRFELVSPYKVELGIRIKADIPKYKFGGNVCVQLPIPNNCQTVTTELGMGAVGQRSEYDMRQRKVIWKLKKFTGGTEQILKVRITFKEQQTSAIRKRIGPISISFEIPNYNVSNLKVGSLRIMGQNKKYKPYRWIKYMTKSQSYICRL
mmetsp:Transcript_45258/g.40546  ORF Transcript_45258/g.40546 Transcript_45258/m.40546 type:complete len:445 (+) Transcript_45258:66-1400(+)